MLENPNLGWILLTDIQSTRNVWHPVGKYLFKVSKITLEQRSIERCSNGILHDFEQVFAHWAAMSRLEMKAQWELP